MLIVYNCTPYSVLSCSYASLVVVAIGTWYLLYYAVSAEPATLWRKRPSTGSSSRSALGHIYVLFTTCSVYQRTTKESPTLIPTPWAAEDDEEEKKRPDEQRVSVRRATSQKGMLNGRDAPRKVGWRFVVPPCQFYCVCHACFRPISVCFEPTSRGEARSRIVMAID